jgi:hypothetical protein
MQMNGLLCPFGTIVIFSVDTDVSEELGASIIRVEMNCCLFTVIMAIKSRKIKGSYGTGMEYEYRILVRTIDKLQWQAYA